jgi:aryl-alcohol dehydrogenase-like predicted oxidoreductase
MNGTMHRRHALQLGMGTAVAAALSGWRSAALAATPEAEALMTRAIPASGERLPVIGLGTNNYSPTTAEERATRRAVLERLTASGARVIDTAPAYRESERTLGELLAELGNRDRAFIATKVTAQGGTAEEGRAMLEESRRRLRTDVLDLVQVHNLVGVEVLLPLLRAQLAGGRIRYVGITTSRASQYQDMLRWMRSEPLDFAQVDYSLGNRAAAAELLPLAQEKKIAVLVNLPFGGRRDGNLFSRVKGQPLPPWAAELDIASWGQFFLKYVVSHPAVTCAIPGMTQLANLEDNLGAARGRLPDAAQRRRMEDFWDALAGPPGSV